MMSTRQFLMGCVDCIITDDLEECLMEKLNVNTKKEMWFALNQHGYFVKHYKGNNDKNFQIIEPMSKRAKNRYKKLTNNLENEMAFGETLEFFKKRSIKL